jgi:hypothetical protein
MSAALSGTFDRLAKPARPKRREPVRPLCRCCFDQIPTFGCLMTFCWPYSIRSELKPFQWAVL